MKSTCSQSVSQSQGAHAQVSSAQGARSQQQGLLLSIKPAPAQCVISHHVCY